MLKQPRTERIKERKVIDTKESKAIDAKKRGGREPGIILRYPKKKIPKRARSPKGSVHQMLRNSVEDYEVDQLRSECRSEYLSEGEVMIDTVPKVFILRGSDFPSLGSDL
jgi:hypothetical protein